ncbi:hypothetical protein HU200_015863 [Digitaria exilis]|uniref:Cytochrome P450 n=1 Tax=Digitaria exilis TaxID=1010633 RepID=A0A835F8H1_9POAL|nr:hypothetical protein HU200_015863 [Digitaria exilis]
MLLRFGELPVVVASSPAAAREITKTHDLAFATRPAGAAARLAGAGEAITNAAYGDSWRQLRKICVLELLTAYRVRSFRAAREDEAAVLLRALAVESSSSSSSPAAVDLDDNISAYVADATARAIIGERFKDKERFFQLMEEGLKLFSRPSLPDLFPSSRLAMLVSRRPGQIKRQNAKMMEFMDTIILEHQLRKVNDGDKEEDLIDVLLRIQRDGDKKFPISMDNIKNVVAVRFVYAGSETSATVLQWAMSEIMRNPRVMEKVQDEVRRVLKGQDRVTEDCLSSLHYLHLVIKETLRLHPPVPLLLPRQCRSPCQILGFDIPIGAMDAPEEFMPEQFECKDVDFKATDFKHIRFGAGRRMCPGSTFGLANVDLVLASRLYHFNWKLPYGTMPEDLDMTEVLGVTTRRKADLLLVPVIRVPV